MVGLWRTLFALAHILDSIKEGTAEHASAEVVQNMKALLQVALDRGSWDNAALLIPTPDPLARPAFGGEESELQSVQSFPKALRDLQSGHQGASHTDTPTPAVNPDKAEKARKEKERKEAAKAGEGKGKKNKGGEQGTEGQ